MACIARTRLATSGTSGTASWFAAWCALARRRHKDSRYGNGQQRDQQHGQLVRTRQAAPQGQHTRQGTAHGSRSAHAAPVSNGTSGTAIWFAAWCAFARRPPQGQDVRQGPAAGRAAPPAGSPPGGHLPPAPQGQHSWQRPTAGPPARLADALPGAQSTLPCPNGSTQGEAPTVYRVVSNPPAPPDTCAYLTGRRLGAAQENFRCAWFQQCKRNWSRKIPVKTTCSGFVTVLLHQYIHTS